MIFISKIRIIQQQNLHVGVNLNYFQTVGNRLFCRNIDIIPAIKSMVIVFAVEGILQKVIIFRKARDTVVRSFGTGETFQRLITNKYI